MSVHDHWSRHLKLFGFRDDQISIIDRKNRFPFVASLNDPRKYFYICHYEALRLMPELRDVRWFHVVADEVHRAKNRKAQQTRALKSLATTYKTGCSGTPADNKPQDLWSVINWLYPKTFTSYWRYIKTYCIEEVTPGRGTTFRKIVGVNPQTIPQLLAQMRPWYVRRLKSEVIDLPEKVYTNMFVDLLPSQRRAYNQMRKDMIAWIGEHEDQPLVAPVVIAQLTRLQQFALASPAIVTEPGSMNGKRVVRLQEPSAKLDALMELVEDNEEEAIVVFSQSRSMVELVAAKCTSKGITAGLYTGMNKNVRDENVRQFQAGNMRVIAATIAAGGEGIELFRSSTCVFLDRHWSPAKNVQAEDRLHRIGQTSTVQIIDYIANNTVDLGRNQQIASKWSTLKQLLGDTVDVDGYIRVIQTGV
jgi:SNF2 family DNA or RNA helicase